MIDAVQALLDRPPLDFVRKRSPSIDEAGGAAWSHIGDELMVITSQSLESDGRLWLHVSFSRPSRVPSYSDTKRVKDAFVGKDRKAIQVFPAASEHVNIHPYCLHLFSCLEDDVLPDFRRYGGL